MKTKKTANYVIKEYKMFNKLVGIFYYTLFHVQNFAINLNKKRLKSKKICDRVKENNKVYW